MAGHPDLPPVSWGDFQQTLGAATDLTTGILNSLGIQTTSDYRGGVNRVIRNLQSGRIALNPAMVKTPELAENVRFIEPAIYTQKYVVLVKKGRSENLNSWNDLKGLVGVTPKGLSFGEKFDYFASNNLRIIRTYHARQGILMLNVGRVDYAIYPDTQSDLFISLMNLEQRFEKAKVDIASFELHIGVSKNTPCELPLEKISEELRKSHKSGQSAHTINDSLYKWMEYSLKVSPISYR
nr:transporter substrate-binding domain-containing protein [Endozoicomonas sp. OPT23]